MVRPGAYRFASAGFLLYLLPLPIPYDRRRRVACLPQIKLRISPTVLPLSPIPEQFSPGAEDNLQILPNRPLLMTFYPLRWKVCPVKIDWWEDSRNQTVAGREDPNASKTSTAEAYRPIGALIWAPCTKWRTATSIS